MLLAGILDVVNGKLVLVKRNVLLSSNASIFLLFPTYICTHALHHDLLRHFTLLYTLIFTSPLCFLLCSKLPPLHHLGATCKNAARYAGSGSARPWQTLISIKSECNFWYGRALPLILFYILL